MRWVTVALWAYLKVTLKASESLCIGGYDFSIVTFGAVLENLVFVYRIDYFELHVFKADELVLRGQGFQDVIVYGVLEAGGAFGCLFYSALVYAFFHVFT